MSMKSYINDIWEAVSTTAKGMRITGRVGIDVKEEVTIQYPEQHGPVFERFRGFLDNDVNVCIACNICVKTCPVDAISLEAVRGADKKQVLVSYDINIGRCMYCGLCVEVCPVKSLKHTGGFENAMLERDEMVLHFIHEDAAVIRQRVAKAVAEAAAKAADEAKAAEAAPKPATPPADTEKK